MKWEFNRDLEDGVFNDYLEMNIGGIRFTKEIIEKLEIKFQTIREVEFLNCKFIGVSFDNVFLAKVKFINCEFLNTSFLECNFNKGEFKNNKFTNVSFFECKLQDVVLNEGIMQYSKMENCLYNGKFEGISLRENIFRHNKISDTEFFNCEFNKDNIIDTSFIKCDLRTSHFKEVLINIDDLISSKVSVLNMIEILSDKGIVILD